MILRALLDAGAPADLLPTILQYANIQPHRGDEYEILSDIVMRRCSDGAHVHTYHTSARFETMDKGRPDSCLIVPARLKKYFVMLHNLDHYKAYDASCKFTTPPPEDVYLWESNKNKVVLAMPDYQGPRTFTAAEVAAMFNRDTAKREFNCGRARLVPLGLEFIIAPNVNLSCYTIVCQNIKPYIEEFNWA